MSPGTPLEWAQDTASASGLQPWSWALALLLALLAGAVVLWSRRRRGPSLWMKPADAPVQRVGRARLNPKVTLEVVEFGGQRILLSVSETGAREIARVPVPPTVGGCAS